MALVLLLLGGPCGAFRAQAQASRTPAEAPAAGTDEARAKVAFEAGREAYDHGRFAEAVQHYQDAYALSGHPQLLFNIARAAELEGERGRALDAYRQYLAALPEADNRDFVEARVRRLQADERAVRAAPVVPSAAQTAARAEVEHSAGLAARTPAHEGEEPGVPLRKRGWLWTAVGVAAAGLATAVVLLTLNGQKSPADVVGDARIQTGSYR